MACISNGNSKLGSIPNISLTPIRACGNCKLCAKNCYALKAYKMYPAVRKAWDGNFKEAKNRPAGYFDAVRDYLKVKRPEFFRWHVSGDILSQKYLEGMARLALEFPGTRFLAFTKMHHLDFSAVPKNLEIVFSLWPGMPIPENTQIRRAWYQNGTETRIPKTAIKCPGSCENCRKCWGLKQDVYFMAH